MSAMRWCSVVAILCGALAACDALFGKERNPGYCAAHPDDPGCLPDGPQRCGSAAECTPPLVCDVMDTGTCVECTPEEAAACTEATPVCGDDHRCRGCSAHAECPASDTCLPDGWCANPEEVAYVQAGGTGAQPCTRAAPCGSLQEGVTAAGASRPYIRVVGTGTLAANAATTIDGKVVTILADTGAKLDRTGDGVILEVRNAGAEVRIYNLEITGASGGAGSAGISIPAGGTPRLTMTRVKLTNNSGGGILASSGVLTIFQCTFSGNAEGGIVASNGVLTVLQSTISENMGGGIVASDGKLTLWQSTISENTGGGIVVNDGTLTVSQSTIAKNTGGGISVTGAFSIVGNVFFANGTATSALGALGIMAPDTVSKRLELNSFNKNAAADGVAPAIQCSVVGGFTARNNIMSDNGTPTNLNQVGGNCAHAYSIVRPGALPPGTGNSSMDPQFVNTTMGDLHVRASSPALGAADPSSDLTGLAERDIDGEVRMSPADIGADEVP